MKIMMLPKGEICGSKFLAQTKMFNLRTIQYQKKHVKMFGPPKMYGFQKKCSPKPLGFEAQAAPGCVSCLVIRPAIAA